MMKATSMVMDIEELRGAEVERLRERFRYQFGDLPYYMLSIDPGWFEIVVEACARIDAALREEEKALFHWRHIKEKFGRLEMYWSDLPPHVDHAVPENQAHIPGKPAQFSLSGETRARIAGLVAEAARRASGHCQVCGAVGKLRKRKSGWLVTACEKHAEPLLYDGAARFKSL